MSTLFLLLHFAIKNLQTISLRTGITFITLPIKVIMEDNEKFPEQKAPEKNIDDAFVQVGKDGAPKNPTSEDQKNDLEKDGHTTTLEHR